jgi:hypothetical protein
MKNETADELAYRFLVDYHQGDEALIQGWRKNADRRWCITLQLCHSLLERRSQEINGALAMGSVTGKSAQ